MPVKDEGNLEEENQKKVILFILQFPQVRKAHAVLSSVSHIWLTEGDSVTLTCDIRGSTEGWRFHWYKTAPYRPGFPQVVHESSGYYIEPVDGGGGDSSYTLSPAGLRHTGVYVCRAERGEPAYHTEFSNAWPVLVRGVSPPASVIIHSNWSQIFTSEPLSLSCGVQGISTGWRLRWFTDSGEKSKCSTDWRSETGSSCSISSASSSDSGVYWCQSESGEQSHLVNITVYHGDVILKSPAHPVTEGDPLTLRCRYRYQPSNISADFYKDGTLLQTSTTGEMTIPAVSKSHGGLYKCSNPERGESPKSWITVRAPYAVSSLLVTVDKIVRLVIIFVITIIIMMLLLLYCFRKQRAAKDTQTAQPGTDHESPNEESSQDQPAGSDGAQSEYVPLQRGITDVYDTIKGEYTPLQQGNGEEYDDVASLNLGTEEQVD
ncbi:high affinity immunoglobulin epsilon receptor subunit alpha-like [Sardina pilchardus]|uniref:high affinity immunoglobulin epsilon receptor subunit alpha-like n=1 Tax=Sardina pilchardus TaxID=27697 RepID=UPI002E11EA9F